MNLKQLFASVGFVLSTLFLTDCSIVKTRSDNTSKNKNVLVWPQTDSSYYVATAQQINPAGHSITFPGEPIDLSLNGDESVLAVKNNSGIVSFNPKSKSIIQTLRLPAGGSSFADINWTSRGIVEKVWMTDTRRYLMGASKMVIASLPNVSNPGLAQNAIIIDSSYFDNVPPQPDEDSWHFIEKLNEPMWTKHNWMKATNPGPQYANLKGGVNIKSGFPDPKSRLETAYEDLHSFFAAGGIRSDKGKYTIETVMKPGLKEEAFKLEVGQQNCRIVATDIEGIRRGIFYLEDEMLSQDGAFLKIGTVEREPFVKRRISRCAYGPIKRPPAMRDELLDNINYYPDNYMNRLAHQGVNGLWLTVDYRDLVSTSFTPGPGKNGVKRLEKLRRTVAQCLRYGIRIYIFTIEPRAWGNAPFYYFDIDVLKKYPELGGAKRGGEILFCPSSETAKKYLYECTNKIFKAVPDLGGEINISQGERSTTCLWAVWEATRQNKKESFKMSDINCPRCSKLSAPLKIIYQSLSAMEKGMHDAAPKAELISWLYLNPNIDWIGGIAAHTPRNVILQLNFETGVTKTVFGKNLTGGDYWLSTPGPSKAFANRTSIAREHGTEMSAKIQTGTSHEVSTVPFVAVPSMIYRKFSAMHRLDVSHAMLGWYFGNYPSLMIKAAGELSFNPFPKDEDSFLEQLASINWKKEDVPQVVAAWKAFAEGYGNYPLQNMMGYYGPMQDGVVWPLLLEPLDAPLAPTWQIGSSTTRKPWYPSGDRIGECLSGGRSQIDGTMDNVLTLKETVELCRRMSTEWDKGLAILNRLAPKYSNDPERILDIGVSKALGIQFHSGYNILRFYMLREEMFQIEGKKRLDILKQLVDIINEEIENDKQLLVLCEKDSRLGFHSEAEGYKYFPAKIHWRMQQLKDVLADDVPEIEKMIYDGKLLFPAFTGKKPEGAVAKAVHSQGFKNNFNFESSGLQWQPCTYGTDKPTVQWSSTYDADSLYIIVSDIVGTGSRDDISGVTVRIEPRRLWPGGEYEFNNKNTDNDMRIVEQSGKRYGIVSIPFKIFWWKHEKLHPLRVDVSVKKAGDGVVSWRPDNLITSRLVFGTANSHDLDWLIFLE